jgi:hypothetical protein
VIELPGLTEAVEASNWTLAAEQAHILEQALPKRCLVAAGSHRIAANRSKGKMK